MKRIKAIFFDAGGTLFQVRGSVGRIYSEVARRYGLQIDPGILDQRFRMAFADAPKTFPAIASPGIRSAERRWWKEVVRQVLGSSLSPGLLEQYFEELYEYFRTADAWSLYPDVPDALRQLRERRFRLGIISNFDSRLRDILANLGIGSFFEAESISWEAGAAKPDPRIFIRGLEMMGISRGQAVHVGDSIREDVEGALSTGMTPVLLDRRGVHSGWTECRLIRTLTELTRGPYLHC